MFKTKIFALGKLDSNQVEEVQTGLTLPQTWHLSTDISRINTGAGNKEEFSTVENC